jgi:hypothetical protein
MSVANANAFALLDDEGTIDAGELAAKLPMAQKDVNAKAETEVKQGKGRIVASYTAMLVEGVHAVQCLHAFALIFGFLTILLY